MDSPRKGIHLSVQLAILVGLNYGTGLGDWEWNEGPLITMVMMYTLQKGIIEQVAALSCIGCDEDDGDDDAVVVVSQAFLG